MPGLIGRKIGMTSVFSADGKNVPCTVIEAGPCVVTQVKTVEKDGYSAVQLGFEEAKEKNTTKPMMGVFKKAGTTPKKHLAEFKFDEEYNLGDTITVEIFNDAKYVDVVGTSKGKGFQGVVKRHGFGGVGQSTHGQDDRARKPGSIGACSYPAKVFKGMRMGGQMGGDRVTTQNLQVLKVIPEQNLLIVKGSFAGCKGSTVLIERQGTAKSKERSEMSGSTRKLGRQKGGGGARRGDINSPVLVGGGRVFGPKPRDYRQKLNKKVNILARKSALSYQAKENGIIVVEDFTLEAPKTKDFLNIVKNLKVEGKKVLVVLPTEDKNVYLSARNLKEAQVMGAANINTYKILNADAVIIAESSLETIDKILTK